jgi:CxxC motif-containing protein (DUF1111 family)
LAELVCFDHGGEATHVIRRFEKVKVPDQEAVIEFLNSL